MKPPYKKFAGFLIIGMTSLPSFAQSDYIQLEEFPYGGTAVQAVTLPAVVPGGSSSMIESQSAWQVQKGQTLRQVLDAWRKKAGWQEVVWKASNSDFVLEANAKFTGSFLDAVDGLFKAIPPETGIKASVYTSNNLIVIEDI